MNRKGLLVEEAGLTFNPAVSGCPRPAVSVVITLYNYSAYIRECLDSVRASRTDGLPGGFEVVVVDDASTDQSAAIVEEYMIAHPLPIRLLKNPVNRGLADARNAGLHAARAPFVFILDADNRIRPDCLPVHYKVMTAGDYALVYGHINRFDHATGKSLGTMSKTEWDIRELITHPCIDAMAMLRKEAVLRVGGYSTEYGVTLPQGWEDYDLCLKLAQAGYRGKMIPLVLSDYRAHSASMINDTNRFRRELALYFNRKFHALSRQYPDMPQMFDVARREIVIAGGLTGGCHKTPLTSGQKLTRQIIGPKMSRSIAKRLAAMHAWLTP